ncbi:hypothetical protein D3C78_1592080 [compost metagenome]
MPQLRERTQAAWLVENALERQHVLSQHRYIVEQCSTAAGRALPHGVPVVVERESLGIDRDIGHVLIILRVLDEYSDPIAHQCASAVGFLTLDMQTVGGLYQACLAVFGRRSGGPCLSHCVAQPGTLKNTAVKELSLLGRAD